MKERCVVTPVPCNEINRIEIDNWDNAQKVLEVLLSSGYQATIVKCEKYYIIEYDWGNVEWSSNTLMWVNSDYTCLEDDE